MSRGRHVRSFDYVNHRYARVRDALKADALGTFTRATKGAAARAEAVAAQLHVTVAGLKVSKDIDLTVGPIEETTERSSPITRLQLEWKAKESARLFPLMQAELSVYPLTATETQLDLSGKYRPPFGVLGNAVDAMIGHRIAEASIHQLLSEVAEHLKKALH